MTDGVLDLLAMILVLAIVVAIGFGLILPLMGVELMGYDENLSDKSIVSDNATNYELFEEKDFNFEELILITQVQDSEIPKPFKLTLYDDNNNKIWEEDLEEKVTKLEIREIGYDLRLALIDVDKNVRYTIGYDFGGITDDWEESYMIKQLPKEGE